MAIIRQKAEECEQKAPPPANNNAASTGSAFKQESTPDRGDEEAQEAFIPDAYKGKSHCFCPKLAKEHGEETAVVLQGLGYKISKSKKVRKGLKWHYDTLATLEKKWPYLRDSGIHGILKRQSEQGNVIKDRFNTWTGDKTCWYSMPDTLVKRCMEEDGKLWFDVPVAIKCHSIVAGTLYQNLRFQILSILANAPDQRGTIYYKINRAALARVLPWSLSTIKREFKELLRQGAIEQNPKRHGAYALSNKDDLIVPEAMVKKAGLAKAKNGSSTEMGIGSSTEIVGSSVEMNGSSTEKIVSETDNYTHYKPLQKHINKDHSLTAPPKVSKSCANAACAEASSVHQGTDTKVCSDTAAVEEDTNGSRPVFSKLSDIHSYIEGATKQCDTDEHAYCDKYTLPIAIDYLSCDLTYSIQQSALSLHKSSEIIPLVEERLHSLTVEVRTNDHLTPHCSQLLYALALEIVVGALLYNGMDDPKPSDLLMHCWDSILSAMEQIPDFRKRSDISAAEKAELLINDARFHNKEGWPTDSNGNVSYHVDTSKKSREEAEEFFGDHPELSSEDVWIILADCVEVKVLNTPEKQFDSLWHARKGIRPSFLFKYWEQIQSQLDEAFR